MFKILITYLTGILQASNLVEKIVFAQLVKVYNKESKETFIAPHEPVENKYLPIDWDKHKGILYIRKKGDITSTDTLLKEKACNNRVFTYSVPLRIVVGVTDKKECFLGDGYAERVISIISGNNSQLKTSLKARTVNIKLTNYSTDGERIAIEEYHNNPRFNYDLSLVAIDVRVEVVSNHNLDCLDPCEPVNFEFSPPATFCERVKNCVGEISGIEDIFAGDNITIDKTDPKNPVISSTGGGGLTCETLAECPVMIDLQEQIDACCGEILTCEVDINFSSESEATDQGWAMDGSDPPPTQISGGQFCSVGDPTSTLFGIIFAGYQDNIEYTIQFNLTSLTPNVVGEEPSIQVQFWGDVPGAIDITEAGDYEFKKAGTLSDSTIIFSSNNSSFCFDNFRICTVEAPPAAESDIDDKQDTLVSGTNIKTINGNSLLGAGDLVISGGGGNPVYYSGNIVTNVRGGTPSVNTSNPAGANFILFYPFIAEAGGNIDQALFQYVSGGVEYRLGFWTAKANGEPDVLVAQTGSVAVGAAGMKILSLSTPIVAGTLYYISVLVNSNINIYKLNTGAPILKISGNLGTYVQFYAASFSFGAMPANTSSLTLLEQTGLCGLVAVRIA